jgi:signal transduction histidine kinase
MALSTVTTTTTTTTIGPTHYYVPKGKAKFPVAVTVTPVILDKKVIGAIEVFRDITKEKQIDKAKNEFISLASHQLKTPPTAVKILTERMLAGELGEITEKQRECISDVRSSNQRMIDVVNTLLDVSHIELGTVVLDLHEKDIGSVLKSALQDLKILSAKKQLRVEESYQKNSSMILIDESLFRMIINNLVVNAINYTPEKGTIKIDYRQVNKGKMFGGKLLNNNSVAITVADTGYGIPKDQQDRLFTKFFRADNVRQKQTDGTGLGLYIVKSLLDNTGGSIWFTSKENKGSIFYVVIPMTGMRSKKDE